ncbi:MAG: folate-binding protein [Paracoccaceae bacterium]
MNGEEATDRQVFRITGADRLKFLQGLVTNDVNRLKDGLIYAAILTPQGKYLADFFLASDDNSILLDCAAEQAKGLAQRLSLYKLRADVTIEQTGLHVLRGVGAPPPGALSDPRHPALGWRLYSLTSGAGPTIDWDAIRVAHCIPETGIELIPNDTFILEVGFERLNGIDFRKGCYVGQEVSARMKHKTELRKGLAVVDLQGTAPVGTEITADGKLVGQIYTQSGGRGIAYLRFDRVTGVMRAGDAVVEYDGGAKGS